MKWLLMPLVLLAGAGLVVQVGFNAALRSVFGSATMAVLTNFLVGSLALLAFVFVSRASWPSSAQIAAAPVWAWLGGLLGVFYVATATIAGPRIGALLLLALSVAGQMVASLLIDHNGWLGFPQEPISATKLLGAALLFAGVLLIAR
jgi:bacterial/archaeal transporter family-2 protein